jgi:hypothetical protein
MVNGLLKKFRIRFAIKLPFTITMLEPLPSGTKSPQVVNFLLVFTAVKTSDVANRWPTNGAAR